MDALVVERVKKAYVAPDGERLPVVDIEELRLAEGAQAALKGRSGSGKTTLLNLIAGVLRAFRRMLRDYLHPAEPEESLCALVRRAVIDNYKRRNKASRIDTRRKYDPPPGPPVIRHATRAQVRLAKRLTSQARNG